MAGGKKHVMVVDYLARGMVHGSFFLIILVLSGRCGFRKRELKLNLIAFWGIGERREDRGRVCWC